MSSRSTAFPAFRRVIPLAEVATIVVIGSMVDPSLIKSAALAPYQRLYNASNETDPNVRLAAILGFRDFRFGKISASINFRDIPVGFDILRSVVFPHHNISNQFNPGLAVLPLDNASELLDRMTLVLNHFNNLLSDPSFNVLCNAYQRLSQTRNADPNPHDTLITAPDGAVFGNMPGDFLNASACSLELLRVSPAYTALSTLLPLKDDL